MKILKHGDLKPRKFICSVCGCEFVANRNEYGIDKTYAILPRYIVTCPCCKQRMFTVQDNAPLYEEDHSNTPDYKLTKIIDRFDRYVHENISIYDHNIYVNLCSMIDELSDWQEEYKNG